MELSRLQEVTIPPDYQERGGVSPFSVLKPSKMLLTNADPEAKRAITIVNIGAQAVTYVQGESDASPLEEDRFVKIKSDLESMKTNGVGAQAAVRIAAQTISVIQAYTSLYNLIAESPIASILPFDGALGPLASLTLKGETLLDNIEAWQQAMGTDDEHEAFVKVLGNSASCLLYGAQLFAFLTMTKVAVSFQVFLSTILYTTTLYDIIVKEYQGIPSEQDEIYKPPVISMKV